MKNDTLSNLRPGSRIACPHCHTILRRINGAASVYHQIGCSCELTFKSEYYSYCAWFTLDDAKLFSEGIVISHYFILNNYEEDISKRPSSFFEYGCSINLLNNDRRIIQFPKPLKWNLNNLPEVLQMIKPFIIFS